MKKNIFAWQFFMLGFFIAVSAAVSGGYYLRSGEADFFPLLYTFLGCVAVGGVLKWLGRKDLDQRLTRADSFLVVGLCWVLFSAVGMIPFLLYKPAGMSVADAFFETMSGFTTTGSTVMEHIDDMPHGLLLWRSLTQWIGGLGIVVVAFALLPFVEFKSNNVFKAETTGISLDKLRPRIGDTARRLLLIYFILTLVCAMLYWAGPMNLFDAANHALTTLATGGFSTHQASIGFFHSAYVEYVAALFMVAAGINFSLYYYVSVRRMCVFLRNEEMRLYIGLVAVAVVVFAFLLFYGPLRGDAEVSIRSAFFHVATIISSTGFQAQRFDYVLWGQTAWLLTVVVMMVGGCAGSTAGGIKVVRVLVYLKWLLRDFLLQLHPRAVLNVKINGQVIPESIVRRVLGFLVTYFLLLVVGVVAFSLMGYDVETSVGTLVSALSNIGPGTGAFGPAFTYRSLPDVGKWLLSFYMLVGRLELFTVFILFIPAFWRQKRLE